MKEEGKYGLFTGYLESLAKDYEAKFLKLKFVESPFLYDESVPLICVATGAGIGPFRAFCQEKKTLNH